MDLGTLVQMPGFWGTKSAQMPARYESAAWVSALLPDQAETQDWTLEMKSAFGQ